MLLLTRALVERGFETKLVFGSCGPAEAPLELEGVPYSCIPSLKRRPDPIADVRAAASLMRIINEYRPAIVHTHMAKAGLLGRVLARRAGVPVVVHTFHGHVLNNYFSPRLSKAFAAAERRVARRTDACIAVSPAVRDDLLERGVGTAERWHVIPLGSEEVELLALPTSPRDARRRLGLPENATIVGNVGRLTAIKDVDSFLDAAALLARDPHLHFAVAGDGELRSALEDKVRGVLDGRVTFLGWVNDVRSLYAALDVVVHTAISEGTPAALIEAGAAGLPVVARDVGGVTDVVREGLTGELVPPASSPETIAAVVRDLLDDPARSRRMGTAARRWVCERFAPAPAVDALADLYTRLLLERAPAATFA